MAASPKREYTYEDIPSAIAEPARTTTTNNPYIVDSYLFYNRTLEERTELIFKHIPDDKWVLMNNREYAKVVTTDGLYKTYVRRTIKLSSGYNHILQNKTTNVRNKHGRQIYAAVPTLGGRHSRRRSRRHSKRRSTRRRKH